MNKVTVNKAIFSGMALLGATLPLTAHASPTLPLDTHCTGTSVRVQIEGFKDRTGNVRVQAYGSNPDDFLASGKKVVRVEGKTPSSGPVRVCVPLPAPGNYALVVLHDRDMNGKLSVSKDGFGFSRNPKLGLGKPDYDEVRITVGRGVSDIAVVLNYRRGLFAVGPLDKD